MKVIISLDQKKTKSFLENCKNKCRYMVFGEHNKISQLVNRSCFKRIKINTYDERFKEQFVKSYIDLMGKLGVEYNSKYWWVTGTSAKNPNFSDFFENLFLFYVIIDKIKHNLREDIFIVNPPFEIVNSIEKYCETKSIEFITLNRSFSNKFKNLKERFIRNFIIVFFVLQTWKRIFYSKVYLGNKIKELVKDEKYYVLESWLYPKSFDSNNKYHDVYFGILPDYLIKKNKRLLIVAGIFRDYKEITKKIKLHDDHLILTREAFLKFRDPVKTVRDVGLNWLRLNEIIFLEGLDITDILQKAIDSEYGGRRVLTVLRDYLNLFFIMRMLNKIKIETFTLPYENLPWEKMCFIALKNYSQQTHIVGYQHAPLSKATLTMQMSRSEIEVVPMPDKIITSGAIPKKILENFLGYKKEKIRAGCALKFETGNSDRMGTRNNSNRILLILRGPIAVSKKLLTFVNSSLKDNDKFSIVIRPHPYLPIDKITPHLDFYLSSCKNFSESNIVSTKDDIINSDIVLYDASVMAVQSLMLGVPIVYLNLGEILNNDPLYDCKYFRWTVNNTTELSDAIKNIYQLSDSEYFDQQKKGRIYIEDYASKATDSKLDEFIV